MCSNSIIYNFTKLAWIQVACTSQNRLNTASSSSESINLGRINVHFPPEKFKKLCKEQQQWRKKKPNNNRRWAIDWRGGWVGLRRRRRVAGMRVGRGEKICIQNRLDGASPYSGQCGTAAKNALKARQKWQGWGISEWWFGLKPLEKRFWNITNMI